MPDRACWGAGASPAKYRVRSMNDSDADALLDFCLQNDQYDRYCGKQPSQELCLYLKETGLKRVLLGIDQDNPQSNAFWAKNGFSVIREVEQEDGTILLAEKCL